MPGKDGVAQQVELAAQRVNLPIVFRTAHGDIPTTVEAMKNGASEDQVRLRHGGGNLRLPAARRDGHGKARRGWAPQHPLSDVRRSGRFFPMTKTLLFDYMLRFMHTRSIGSNGILLKRRGFVE